MTIFIRGFGAEEPGKFGQIKLDDGKVIGFKIACESNRVRADDHPRVKSRDVAGTEKTDLHRYLGHIPFALILEGYADRDLHAAVDDRITGRNSTCDTPACPGK